MNISSNIAVSQYSSQLSILRSANKQPELALDLIMKTAQSLENANGMQSAPQNVAPVSSSSSTIGQLIDIMA